MITGTYTVHDIYELRKNTRVGESIKFKVDHALEDGTDIVKGKIAAKYPHVFMLTNGKTYSWVDYLLGKQSVIDIRPGETV